MNPIIIVDSNKDDSDFLVESLIDAGAKAGFRCFNSSVPALEYLKTTGDRPSLIISDTDLPQINGFLFKNLINEDKLLCEMNIPFIFFSVTKNTALVNEAHELSAQGYIQKPDNITDFDIVAIKIKNCMEKNQFRDKRILN